MKSDLHPLSCPPPHRMLPSLTLLSSSSCTMKIILSCSRCCAPSLLEAGCSFQLLTVPQVHRANQGPALNPSTVEIRTFLNLQTVSGFGFSFCLIYQTFVRKRLNFLKLSSRKTNSSSLDLPSFSAATFRTDGGRPNGPSLS